MQRGLAMILIKKLQMLFVVKQTPTNVAKHFSGHLRVLLLLAR